MSAIFQSFTGAERAAKRKEPPAVKAQRIVASLLAAHLAKRHTVGLDTPLDAEDQARLKLVLKIFKGPHGGENVRPIIHTAFPDWAPAKPPTPDVVTSGD